MTIESGYLFLEDLDIGTRTGPVDASQIYPLPGVVTLHNPSIGIELRSISIAGHSLVGDTLVRVLVKPSDPNPAIGGFLVCTSHLTTVGSVLTSPAPVLLPPNSTVWALLNTETPGGDAIGIVSVVVETDPAQALERAGGATLPGAYTAPAPALAPIPDRPWWRDFI